MSIESHRPRHDNTEETHDTTHEEAENLDDFTGNEDPGAEVDQPRDPSKLPGAQPQN